MMDIEKLENCPSCKKDLGQGEYDGQYCKSCNAGMGFAAATQADEVKVVPELEEAIQWADGGMQAGHFKTLVLASKEHLKRQKGR